VKKIRNTIVTALLAACAALLLLSPAAASRSWCLKDPIVNLNGSDVQIWVGIPDEFVPAVNGPIAVDVRTPAGVTQQVVLLDEGFNGYGEIVTFGTHAGVIAGDGSFDAELTVRVPVDLRMLRGMNNARNIPLRVIVIQGDETSVFEGVNNGMRVTIQVTGASAD
jgi:hypothetical protein